MGVRNTASSEPSGNRTARAGSGRLGNRPAARQAAAVGGSDVARPCILVVDDEPHDREIYGRTLCYNGFDVAFARSGAEALRLVQTEKFDAILLDLGLPDVPGLELLQQLRQRVPLRSVPVIVLSSFSEKERGEAVRRAGCARYIEKPASPVAVLHAVEELLGRAPVTGLGRPPRVINDDA